MSLKRFAGYLPGLIAACSLVNAAFGASFSDEHNDGSLSGWSIQGDRQWVENGTVATPVNGSLNQGFLINSNECGSAGVLEVKINADQWNGYKGGIVLRWSSPSLFYFVAVEPGNQYSNFIKLVKNSFDAYGGSAITVAQNFSMGTSYTLKVEMSGSTFKFYIDGVLRGTVTDETLPTGKIGYGYSSEWNDYIDFDYIKWTESSSAISSPSNLSVSNTSSRRGVIDLSWSPSPSADVTGYNILRDGAKVGTSLTTNYTDGNVTTNKKYVYSVEAYSGGGDVSAPCPPVTAVVAKTDCKILVLNYDPVLKAGTYNVNGKTVVIESDQKISARYHYNNADSLISTYIKDINKATDGVVNFSIYNKINLNSFPPAVNHDWAYASDGEGAVRFMAGPETGDAQFDIAAHDGVDYRKILSDNNIISLVNSGEVDQVWTFSMTGSGFSESALIGRGASNLNGFYLDTAVCRLFPVFGFASYANVSDMFHKTGHAIERVFITTKDSAAFRHITNWWPDKFNMKMYLYGTDGSGHRRDFTTTMGNVDEWLRFYTANTDNSGTYSNDPFCEASPGNANLGCIHYAPNAQYNNDYGRNEYEVDCYADDWADYPNLTGKHRMMNSCDWGAWYDYTSDNNVLTYDERAKHYFLFSHYPKNPGIHDNGVLNNWWPYYLDMSFFDGKPVDFNVVFPPKNSIAPAPEIIGSEYGTEGNSNTSWGVWFVNDRGYSATVTNETINRIAGTQSTKFKLSFGEAPVFLRFPSTTNAHWNLSDAATINFYIKIDQTTTNYSDLLGANPVINLCTDQGNKVSLIPNGNANYFNSPLFTPDANGWFHFQVPVLGDDFNWTRRNIGHPDLSSISYIEFSIRKNTQQWQNPVTTVYLDGVTFGSSFASTPSIPANLVCTSTSGYSVSLGWTASNDCIGYRVYRDGLKIASTTQTAFTDNTCSPVSPYSYYIKAINNTGDESAASNSVNAVTQASPSPFSDNFEDGNADGWINYSGNWSIVNGRYHVLPAPGAKSVVNNTFGDFHLSADVQDCKGDAYGDAGILFRVSEPKNSCDSLKGYLAGISAGGDQVFLARFNNDCQKVRVVSLNIDNGGSYHITVDAKGASIKVYVDGILYIDYRDDAPFRSGTIGFRNYSSEAYFDNISIVSTTTAEFDFSDGGTADWAPCGGTWMVTNGKYNVDAGVGNKSILYKTLIRNYTYEGDVSVQNPSGTSDAGLIFRVTSPSAGENEFYGYCASIDVAQGKVVLAKFKNSRTVLDQKPVSLNANTSYRIKVVVNETEIFVYVNNQLYISYNDPDALFTGTVGVRSNNAVADFDNLNIINQ
jgi:hypothetical protein